MGREHDPVPPEEAALKALRKFAASVKRKMSALSAGEPEDQLRRPFEILVEEVGEALGIGVVCKGESTLPGRHGKPDYAIHAQGLLAGFAELKAPGKGADPRRFTGHDKKQWKRFQDQPNLLYCDGNEWGLYRDGKAQRRLVRLAGAVPDDGSKAVAAGDARAVHALLTDFLSWQPVLPVKPDGEIDLRRFAAFLAPLCRMLRHDVAEAVRRPESPLVQLAKDWRQLLFPDASDEQFADAYAQTVTFALLLARSERADPLTLPSAESALAGEHSLLSRALEVLTDPNAQAETSASVSLLIRVIGEVPVAALSVREEPWLHFYEDFLAVYDPKLRKDAGAYYTPVEVVRAQVRLIDELLTNRLGKRLGFADRHVVTLDPAVGTGTYLLGVIRHALDKVNAQQGAGAVPGQATALAANLYGFENMVGPFAVCELRVSRALEGRGAKLPAGGTHVYLTDTLESPNTPPPALPFYLKPIAEQHAMALEVKRRVPVIVCVGNPPYDRHEAADQTNKASTGGWVRWGEHGDGTGAIFRDFVDPAIAAGHSLHVKNLYNSFVYFWRWALWKAFEHESATGPGVVSYISSACYLDGDGFVGMREHMRRVCDEVWVVDVGGERRGTRQSENVFPAIRTPVAIAVAARYGEPETNTPAKVRFARIGGETRKDKLAALEAIANFKSLQWEDCPEDWQAPFRPAGTGRYFAWPFLTDLLPWQHSGVQLKRTWPIAPDKKTLEARWRALLAARSRAEAFHGTGDREIEGAYRLALTPEASSKPIAKLPPDAPVPPMLRYAYRSFDRQYLIADARLISRPRPALWHAHSHRQLYLSTTLQRPLGRGPALTAAALLCDLNHFCNRGAKDCIPLYRGAKGKEGNILPGLLDLLGTQYAREVTHEDFVAYVYGVLAQPVFADSYAEELGSRQLRVPVTKDAALFTQARDLGAKLLWLHTYGERFVPPGETPGCVPDGKARCTKAVPDDPDRYPDEFSYDETTETLRVGQGVFHPVEKAVWEFQVSGLEVVKSWLRYRKKSGHGRKSSPLDDIRPERWPAQFTSELLELLWVLDHTLALYPKQAELLEAVLAGPLFHADDFPPVPDELRKPPKPAKDHRQKKMWAEE